jgi:hypothetical protein
VCPSPENRVYNPGFELDSPSPLGWQIDDPDLGKTSTDSSVKAPGHNSPKAFFVIKTIGENDLSYSIYQNNIAVPIGTTVEVSAYVQTFDTTNPGVITRFILYFDDVIVRTFDLYGNTNWQKIHAVVPAVTTPMHSIRIRAINANLAYKFSFSFDDVSVVAVPASGCVPPPAEFTG